MEPETLGFYFHNDELRDGIAATYSDTSYNAVADAAPTATPLAGDASLAHGHAALASRNLARPREPQTKHIIEHIHAFRAQGGVRTLRTGEVASTRGRRR